MIKSLSKILAGAGLAVAAFLGGGSEANASYNDYCREYTRTVYIGSRTQEAYGQACLQPDGSWMIVGEGPRYDIPDNATNVNYIIHDQRRNVVPGRVVYYNSPSVVIRTGRARPSFIWDHNGHYKNGHYVRYDRRDHRRDHRRYDRHDRRHDRDDDRGRGRGPDRDRYDHRDWQYDHMRGRSRD